jgi:hypothetical protein
VDFRKFVEFRNYTFWESLRTVFKCDLMGDPQF